MLLPLVLLAFLSVTGGWIGIPHALGGSDRFARFLDPVTHGTGVPASFEQVSIAMRTGAPIPTTEPTTKPEDPQTERVLTGCSVLAALLGWLLADTLYRRKPQLPARMAASSRHALWTGGQQILGRRDVRLPRRQATAGHLPLHPVGWVRSRLHRRRRPRASRRNARARARCCAAFNRAISAPMRAGSPSARLPFCCSLSSALARIIHVGVR